MVASEDRPNSVQISLMRLFDRPMAPDELNAVHQLLMNHYSQLIAEETDALIARKGYTQADLDRVLNTSQRSS